MILYLFANRHIDRNVFVSLYFILMIALSVFIGTKFNVDKESAMFYAFLALLADGVLGIIISAIKRA